MNKMTEKQPDWIETLVINLSKVPEHTRIEYARKVIKWHQESTYESGYQKGRDDMKSEMECNSYVVGGVVHNCKCGKCF